jgi:hypothetical protein
LSLSVGKLPVGVGGEAGNGMDINAVKLFNAQETNHGFALSKV